MNVQQLMETLDANRTAALQLILPTGAAIPSHFHITEVGRVDKRFIDCGGTRRTAATCLLQAWVAHDLEHRLASGKLADIVKLALPLLESTELEVEVEYGPDVAAQYRIYEAVVTPGQVRFTLSGKLTDCLAKERCGVGDGSDDSCCK